MQRQSAGICLLPKETVQGLVTIGCLEGSVRLFATTDRTLRNICLQVCEFAEHQVVGAQAIVFQTVRVSNYCLYF